MKDNAFKLFQSLVDAYIYNANYCALQEMGAGNEMLKAYEEYERAPLEKLQEASAYVAAWQQAKISEMTKNGYLEARRKQEKAKADYGEKRGFDITMAAQIKKYES